ncbi:MAG: hypothetical protein KAQ84_01195 [Thermoplasmatales archaeon]|nr:hypothetical protein [Thermoplasmatales archaeon]MCK5261649.1 hypothetical protein [Thermoplasmatales archaeon]
MAYMYKSWALYKGYVELKDGNTITPYFFSKRTPKSGIPCDLPNGYTVAFNSRTSLPYLNRKLLDDKNE